MPVELKVPAVGESITEVQIGDWLKQPGESANLDEALVVIETDKVTVELPAPIAGRVVQVLKPKGAQAKVGEVIGYMEAGGSAKDSPPEAARGKTAAKEAKSEPAARAAVEPARSEASPKTAPADSRSEANPKTAPAAKAPAESFVMPSAARAIATGGVDAARVQPTGPGGRTLKEDVQRAAGAPAASPPAPAPTTAPAPASKPAASAPSAGSREEEVVPMTPLRKRVAQRLVEARNTAAILTTFNEIDMSRASALRKEHQERFVERYGIKLGFMSFFVKASIEALKRVPAVNAEVRGDAIAYRNYFDIGIAVGGGKGLVVPVVRNAERLSFAQIEQAIAELGGRARENKLSLEELSGGTFTISNGGIYGSLLSTPILNPPQSGILGLHAIQDRAVVEDGAIVVRPMMYVALSYDHRVIDGREAVTFLKTVKECVEDPARMLLEMSAMPRHDLVIIGAGPGGYVAALRAAQLGLDVACIEKEPRLGGVCLRVGCIPSKALLESSDLYHESKTRFSNHGIVLKSVELDLAQMMKRKDETVDGLTRGVASLFKKNKVTRYEGHARLLRAGAVSVAASAGEQRLECKHVMLATGSVSAVLKGVELDFDRIGTSTEALSWTAVPKHLVVIGAGVIGLELGSVWARLGAKVTVLEYLDRILPGMDSELAKEAQRLFEKQGMTFLLRSRVLAARATKKGAIVNAEGREPIECDRVLLAVGRTPNTEGLGLEQAGVVQDKRGSVIVDEHFATNVAGVYAIGDLIRGPMLAHKAEEEGIACVERIVTGHGHVNYDAIPNVVYTAPEIASVGHTEEELTAAGVPFKKGSFPFQANARARALGHTEGRVKILAHRDTDRVLGVHILGPRAGDLIAECTAAIEFGASSEDVARTCHAHPTLSEAVKEAALAVDGRTLNI